MSERTLDWESAYGQSTATPWSIGEPQPAFADLIARRVIRGGVLDAGCGEGALSLALAAQGISVVGLDSSRVALARARARADELGLTNATFAQADVTDFHGYDEQFNTVVDCGLLHALPVERRQAYIHCIHRAAAPGAGLFILAFSTEAFGSNPGPGPNGFTHGSLVETVATRWAVDDVHPATLVANDTHEVADSRPHETRDRDSAGRLQMPGFFMTAHKD